MKHRMKVVDDLGHSIVIFECDTWKQLFKFVSENGFTNFIVER